MPDNKGISIDLDSIGGDGASDTPVLSPDQTPQDPTDDGSQSESGIAIDLEAIGSARHSSGIRAFSTPTGIDVTEFSKYMDGVDSGVGDIYERRAQN